MTIKKVLILIVALLLPVLIFLFLKIFGKNEFEVKPLHQQDVVSPAGCDFAYASPYVVADSVMRRIRDHGSAELYLLTFSTDESISDAVTSEVGDNEIRILAASERFNDLEFVRKCVLLAPSATDLVLVDDRGQIRGYYESTDLDEVDRLVVESKIILKQY